MKLSRYSLLSLLLLALVAAFWQAEPSAQFTREAATILQNQEPVQVPPVRPAIIPQAPVIQEAASSEWPGFEGIVRAGELLESYASPFERTFWEPVLEKAFPLPPGVT